MVRETRFHAAYNPASLDYEVFLVQREQGAFVQAFAKPVEFETRDGSAPMPRLAPMLSLDEVQMQGLMDALWATGVRPTQEGTAGQLDATRAHLADMKAIAVGALAKIGVKA